MSGLTCLLSSCVRHPTGGFSVFAGVGERTREGNDLYKEMIESVRATSCTRLSLQACSGASARGNIPWQHSARRCMAELQQTRRRLHSSVAPACTARRSSPMSAAGCNSKAKQVSSGPSQYLAVKVFS